MDSRREKAYVGGGRRGTLQQNHDWISPLKSRQHEVITLSSAFPWFFTVATGIITASCCLPWRCHGDREKGVGGRFSWWRGLDAAVTLKKNNGLTV